MPVSSRSATPLPLPSWESSVIISRTARFFVFTAALGVPTLLALASIRPADIDPDLARGGRPPEQGHPFSDALRSLADNRPLLIFAGAVFLFQLSNAAALPT